VLPVVVCTRFPGPDGPWPGTRDAGVPDDGPPEMVEWRFGAELGIPLTGLPWVDAAARNGALGGSGSGRRDAEASRARWGVAVGCWWLVGKRFAGDAVEEGPVPEEEVAEV
jgi:hypothetical protein